MIVTIVCDVLGKPNNGTSLAAYNLIHCLKERGHIVKVICPDKDKEDNKDFYVLDSIDFKIFNGYMDKNGIRMAKGDESIIEIACKDADIVHCMTPFSAGKCALKYCKKHNIPVTSGFHMQAENFTAHLKLQNASMLNDATYRFLWKTYYRYMDGIHYPTVFIRDFVKKYNKNNVPSYCISNGVNTTLFYDNKIDKPKELKDKFVIVMSGRLSNEKNQKAMIKALKYSKHEKDIQLYFCGNGPKEEYLRRLARKRLTNQPIIKLHTHEDLHDALWMADLCVHTSIVEIEAISVLEAFACGLVPVISNSPRSATSKFALYPESSYNYRSLKDLATKVDYWFEHPVERKEASKRYVGFAKQFDFEKCMDSMEKMLIEVKENHDKKNERR